MTEVEVLLRNMLRTRLTDPNATSRVGEYVVDDFPRITDLTINQFPIVSVMQQFESGRPFGLNSTNALISERIQLDIFTKPDHVLTISGAPYEGFKLLRWIMRDINNAIYEHNISDLVVTQDILYMNVVNFYPPKFDYTYNLHRQTGDITMAIYKP